MEIFLPIADMHMSPIPLLFTGLVAGVLAGWLGIGGGIISLPVLIWMGLPPHIVAATQTIQLLAAAASGSAVRWRLRRFDSRLVLLMICGGFFGIAVGMALFTHLNDSGTLNNILMPVYIFVLTLAGIVMTGEGIKTHFAPSTATRPLTAWMTGPVIPLALGLSSGAIISFMGLGGAFLTLPVMIYLLRVPTDLAAGTSLLAVAALSAIVAPLHGTINNAIDPVLAMLLVAGTLVGAPLGAMIGTCTRDETARLTIGLLALVAATRLTFGVV
ncbi:MAG: sulfite exporter TauE/SafE family protein [Pseudomonadota bacterium]|nr:sulfite exporter TauE/SafE family protein [Pseudomonadota bacterium]